MIEATDNLLCLDVDLGDEGKLQLVAGIAKTHEPSQLEGKQIAVVVNLEEKEIKGVLSQGMFLACESEGKPVLIVPEKKVKAGIKIR